MTRIYIFCLVLLFFLTGPGAAENYPKTAVMKTMSGSVYLKRSGRTYKARQGIDLQKKDIVITKEDGYAGVLFKDGTVITLGPSSEFTIEAYVFEPQDQAYFFNFYMQKGSLIYNSGKISKLSPESVFLTTPKATVGIRGTRFIVDLN